MYRDVIHLVESIYNMKTNIAKVEYPETFAQKIRKIFNYDSILYAKALEQVCIHAWLAIIFKLFFHSQINLTNFNNIYLN